MKIHHIAIWTGNMDEVAAFWAKVLGAKVGPIYVSHNRPGFQFCWLTLSDGPKIELMTGPWVADLLKGEREDCAHVAVSVGAPSQVDSIAARLGPEGSLVSGPRRTGDGFY